MMTEAEFKDALRDLVAANGGLERAATIVGLGTSHLARLYDHKEDKRAHMMVVLQLEAACGRPVVTERAARAVQFRPDVIDLERAGAKVILTSAEAFRETNDATHDGKVTPFEAARIRRAGLAVQDAVDALAAAATRAAGGEGAA